MADDSTPDAALQARKTAVQEKPATPWVVPAITALILISAFCLYYFVYVAAQREYLANRNFRSLAGLGDQVQTMVSVHGSILEYYADLADPRRKASQKQDLNQYSRLRPEDALLKPKERDEEARKDYLKYLAPNFAVTEVPVQSPAKPAKPPARLDVRRRNGRWELVLTAQRHQGTGQDYVGSLELADVMKPLIGSLPFDDILLVSEKGTVVYQSNQAGPQFMTLSDLLQAQSGSVPVKGEGAGTDGHSATDSGSVSRSIDSNADQVWRNKPVHLTDLTLAGTRYKLFLQPVLVDVFSDEPGEREPAHEWVLCGLRSAKALEWEALSISSTIIIGFTAVFLAICMSGPILKVLFMNGRERLRLRELGFLGIFLVLLTCVFTLTGLEVTGYPLNDDTDKQLERLGRGLSGNVHNELQQMRGQLMAWCRSGELREDLSQAQNRKIIRNAQGKDKPGPQEAGKTPDANIYPYLNNVFWTDDDGNQIVKWSTSGYLTPLIPVSGLDIFTHPKEIYIDGKAPPFYFDAMLAPNRLEYLSALTVSTADCNPDLLKPDSRGRRIREDITGGSAFLTARPLSLIDPILPLGYGFALLGEKGVVLFHSDKNRNRRENFLQESDGSRQLYAAAFGHSTERSLAIKYLGRDYRARVIPVADLSQAPWTLVVYRDLTSVRTLNLQAMTMASSLLLIILLPPVLAVMIWCASRRLRFAPEWLWPNRERTANYVFLAFVYGGLILVFSFLGFAGPVEHSLIACALVPYAALSLTVWSFRAWSPEAAQPPTLGSGKNRFGLAVILAAGAISLATALWPRVHLQAFLYFSGFAFVASVALLDRPRRILTVRLLRSFPAASAGPRNACLAGPDSYAWRKYYVLSFTLLLFLFGVLTPAALFRASLNVERRLGVKQAQLHLASALGQRLMQTKEECENDETGKLACDQFANRDFAGRDPANKDNNVWGRIVLDPMLSAGIGLRTCPHSECQGNGGELYDSWFQNLVYRFHHDYNDDAAEMLGVIRDRASAIPITVKSATVKSAGEKTEAGFPDWSWENAPDTMTLRWHGVQLPGQDPRNEENDLLIASNPPDFFRGGAFAGAAVALGVILGIGFLLWALVRRVFLFHVHPLKIAGARKAIESIREGKNVVVLVPPGSDWRPEGTNSTIDVAKMANGPTWAEALDLDEAPFRTTIEIHHFEYCSNDDETDKQKFFLLERLLKRANTQLVVILALPASPEDPRRTFTTFEVIDLREEPFYWLRQYEGPAQDLIWKECGPMAALWPIGAQLARDIGTDDDHSEETIASEILERADPYYRLVWKECSADQKFALAQLAEDGLLNPANGRAIGQLVRRGLITPDPQFRIMNESFRRFVRSAASVTLKHEWLRDSRRSGWGKVHGAFLTTMIILGAFLLTTQNALWQSSAAYVTTALGALGTLTRLFNTFRGGASIAEKAD